MKKRTKIIIGVIGLIIISVVVVLFINSRNKRAGKELRTVRAEVRDIKQEITFSGNVRAEKTAELAFEMSGPITGISVEVGDKVTKGQLLASVDSRSLALEYQKANATLLSTVEQAEIAWKKEQQDVADTKTVNEKTLAKYKQAVIDAKKELEQVKIAYEKVKDESGEDSSVAKTKYSAYLAARTAYNSAQKARSENIESINKTLNSSRKEEEAAEAKYKAAIQASSLQSGLSALEAAKEIAALAVEKSNIYAPFAGVITQKFAEVGSFASAGKTALAMQNEGVLEISANVPETDALKLEVGQKATITFDALFSSEKTEAEISSISPSAKDVAGVPVFEVELHILGDAQKIRPGITANVTVHAAKKDSVIGIQRRAITSKDGKQFVNVVDEKGVISERQVTTGLLGSDGIIEITTGLKEGESVVISREG